MSMMSAKMHLLIVIASSYNLNLDIYGHRGGVLQLLPETSIASYALGAQEGAEYLEPDIVVSSDGVLIVSHDLELSRTTDVASHPEFAHRFITVSDIWTRGNPNHYTNGQPRSMINTAVEQSGWFVFNFTAQELKTLNKISTQYPHDSPLNHVFKILTFDEMLELTNNLSSILNKTIGVIPETKVPEWLQHIGFVDIESRILQSLEKYGFLSSDENSGYYEANYMYDSDGNEKPKVILQSFTQESLHRFAALSDGSIPNMFLLQTGDINEENGINETLLEWVLTFSDIIGIHKSRVHHLVDARNEYGLEYDITTYTLIEDINEYIGFVSDDLIGVFSDSAGTGRVVKEVLQLLVEDSDGSSVLSSFCSVANESEKIDKVELKYALIAGFVALCLGILFGVVGFYYWQKHKDTSSETEQIPLTRQEC